MFVDCLEGVLRCPAVVFKAPAVLLYTGAGWGFHKFWQNVRGGNPKLYG